MTVLAHIWTPEGFVVAADGRGISAGTRRVLNDDRRKLIPLRALGVDLICGWLGVTQVAWKTGQVFDLSEETKRIGGVLSGEQSGLQYIERFSDNLRHCFTDALDPFFQRMMPSLFSSAMWTTGQSFGSGDSRRNRAAGEGPQDGSLLRSQWAPRGALLPTRCLHLE